MSVKIKYQFTGKIWQYKAEKGGWYFISLPIEISSEIRKLLQWQEEGWGRLKATAKINATEWETAIWFDSKVKTYLLPLKADIRKKEKLNIDVIATVELFI